MLVATATGCSPSPATQQQGVPGSASPGAVAVAYVRALFSGDVVKANGLVAPAYRNVLAVIAAGHPPAVGLIRNLAVGSTSVRGDSAIVILTGTLCGPPPQAAPASPAADGPGSGLGGTPSPGSSTPGPKAASGAVPRDSPNTRARRCFTNTSASSSDPAFRVALVRSPGTGDWQVIFPIPSNTPHPPTP